MKKITTIEEWKSERPLIQTGDLFFTRRKGIASRAIALGSPVSHVGFLLRYEDRLFGFDSTTFNGRKGVNVFNFSNLFHPVEGDIYILHLSLSARERDKLKTLSRIFCHIPYEKKTWRLAYMAFGGHPKVDQDSLFCSELVVKCFNILTDSEYPSHKYHPKDLLPSADTNFVHEILEPRFRYANI